MRKTWQKGRHTERLNCTCKLQKLMFVIMLYFGYNLKTTNIWINCNKGKSTKNPPYIFGFFYLTAYWRVYIQPSFFLLLFFHTTCFLSFFTNYFPFLDSFNIFVFNYIFFFFLSFFLSFFLYLFIYLFIYFSFPYQFFPFLD